METKIFVSPKKGTPVLLVGTIKGVRQVLAGLWQKYPGLRDRMVNEQGEVRQHVNIFIGEEKVRDCGGFAATVSPGAAITIVPAVSGG